MRTPSTKTTRLLVAASPKPRKSRTASRPPLRSRRPETPPSSRTASLASTTPESRISWPVITVAPIGANANICSLLLAVTKTSGRLDCAKAEKETPKARGSTPRCTRKIPVFIEGKHSTISSHRRPRQCMSVTVAHLRAQPPCWPVSGLVESTSIAFPSACSKTLSDNDESGTLRCVHLPLRGQRRLGSALRLTLLLPVELRHANHTASTNALDSSRAY